MVVTCSSNYSRVTPWTIMNVTRPEIDWFEWIRLYIAGGILSTDNIAHTANAIKIVQMQANFDCKFSCELIDFCVLRSLFSTKWTKYPINGKKVFGFNLIKSAIFSYTFWTKHFSVDLRDLTNKMLFGGFI